MNKRDMTRAKLIEAIKVKVKRAKPFVRDGFIRGPKYQKKSELERIRREAKVSRDGYDISLV